MAVFVVFCPIDGLALDLSYFDEWSAYLATFAVGDQNKFWTDHTVTCANGHHWAINYNVEHTRTA